MTANRSSATKWLIGISVFALLAVVSGFLVWRSLHIDNFTRDWVVRSLSERFDTQVDLAGLRVTAFPELAVQGRDLTIHHRERGDIPFIHVDAFTFHLGVLGIFRVPHEIHGVSVQNMSITIVPRGEAASRNARESPKNQGPTK